MNEHIEPLEDFTGDRFVNRDEEFRRCRKWADNIPDRHENSWALVGRRRTGWTAGNTAGSYHTLTGILSDTEPSAENSAESSTTPLMSARRAIIRISTSFPKLRQGHSLKVV